MHSVIINLHSNDVEIMAKREYRGCEWESPIYRQIIAEKKSKEKQQTINEWRTKRGKQSK